MATTHDTTAEPLHVQYRRLLAPRARRTYATAIVRATSCRTVYGCVCGARHSESARWGSWRPGVEGQTRTVHAARWREAHADHLLGAVAAASIAVGLAAVLS